MILYSFYQSVQLTGSSCFLAHEVAGSFRVSPVAGISMSMPCSGMKYFCKYSPAMIKVLPFLCLSFQTCADSQNSQARPPIPAPHRAQLTTPTQVP